MKNINIIQLCPGEYPVKIPACKATILIMYFSQVKITDCLFTRLDMSNKTYNVIDLNSSPPNRLPSSADRQEYHKRRPRTE